MSKTKLLIAAALAALAIPTAPYVARQIVVLAPPPVMPAGPSDPSDLIPEERLVDWTPGTYVGVPGGIPTDRTQCVTTECAAVTGAASGYKDGTLDASSLLQAAITSAPANTYVLVPAGTWKILSQLTIGPSDDSITLRGASVSTTIFDCHAGTCFYVGSESDYTWAWPPADNNVTAYGVSGANSVLTMADTANFSAGQLIQWIAADDRTIPVMNVGGYGAGNAQYSTKQMTKIVSKTATTLTVFPAIYHYADYVGVDAIVHVAQFQGDLIGLEDFTVDGTNGPSSIGIQLNQTTGSWVKNVRVANITAYHVKLIDSLMPEVRHSHIETRVGGGSNGSAILVNTTSGALVEDNIIEESFPLIEVNAGSSGNVFAYNFIHNDNGAIAILSNHGPHNRYNLYEGNLSTNLLSDGYFGGEDAITIYRNHLHANGIIEADDNSYCMSLKRFTRRASIVGNVLGGPFSAGACELSVAANTLGKPNIGNNDSIGTAQPSLGDWWDDFDGADTTIAGELTSRTKSDTPVNFIDGFPTGTAVAGGASTITLHADAFGITDLYKYHNIVISSGTGSGQERMISAYNGGTKVATVASAWDVQPDNTSVFSIYNVTIGVITLSSGTLVQFRAPYIWSSDGSVLHATTVGTTPAVGDDYDVTVLNGTLPALNDLVKIWPGPPGYQELDLDVEATTIQKVNYDTFSDDLTGDGLDGAILVDSLFRDSKPSFFNSLTWPPVDPNNPVHDYEIIPAGYRYVNAGSDPP